MPDWSPVSVCFLVWSWPVHTALIPQYTSLFTPTSWLWAAQFSLSAAWMTMLLLTGYLLTNDLSLASAVQLVHVFGKNYLSTPQYHTGSAKIIKGIRRSKMWDYWKKSSCLINVKTSTTGFSPERWIACVTCMLLSNRDYYEWWCYGESRSQIMIKLHDENRSLKPHNSKLFPLYIKSVSKHKKSV